MWTKFYPIVLMCRGRERRKYQEQELDRYFSWQMGGQLYNIRGPVLRAEKDIYPIDLCLHAFHHLYIWDNRSFPLTCCFMDTLSLTLLVLITSLNSPCLSFYQKMIDLDLPWRCTCLFWFYWERVDMETGQSCYTQNKKSTLESRGWLSTIVLIRNIVSICVTCTSCLEFQNCCCKKLLPIGGRKQGKFILSFIRPVVWDDFLLSHSCCLCLGLIPFHKNTNSYTMAPPGWCRPS